MSGRRGRWKGIVPAFGNVAGEGFGSLAGGQDNVPGPAFRGHERAPAMRSASREACALIDVPCCARSPWGCMLKEADGAALAGGEGNRTACAGLEEVHVVPKAGLVGHASEWAQV